MDQYGMHIYAKPMKQMLFIAVLVAGFGSARAQQLWRVAGQQELDEAFRLPPSEFSEPRVIDLCRAFMDANSNYDLLRYFIVTDRNDAIERLRGPGITDIDFPVWLHAYQQDSPQPPATAELIRVRDQAVVRMRFADGEIAERVIGTGNPLLIDYQGESAKVLDIAPIPPGLVMRAPYPGGSHFFVQTSRPWTLTLAEGFKRALQTKTGLTNVAISIEDGWWFAGEATYPVYNRFLPYLEPPSFEEFKKHTRFYCQDLSGSCIQTGPARR